MSPNIQTGTMDREELKFFGRVSASVSHEIKNVFAVINEGAGLLDDLCLLAAKGRPLDPERLQSVARSILSQIRRGDEIVKNMNAFAHSVDEDMRDMDLGVCLELIVKLSRRNAAAKSVQLELDENRPAQVRTDPYSLGRLLHGVIALALESAESGAVFTLSAGPVSATPADGAQVTLSGATLAGALPESLECLTRRLAASVRPGDTTGTVVVRLPRTLPGDGGQI
ncbi:MAG: sensor histidine kinase [Desulfovibrio sp.]